MAAGSLRPARWWRGAAGAGTAKTPDGRAVPGRRGCPGGPDRPSRGRAGAPRAAGPGRPAPRAGDGRRARRRRPDVFLRASCDPRPCTARARAGAGGRWRVALPLTRRARRALRDDRRGPRRSGRRRWRGRGDGGGRWRAAWLGLRARRRLGAGPRRRGALPRAAHAPARGRGDRRLAGGGDGGGAARRAAGMARARGRTHRPRAWGGLRILGEVRDAPAILALSLFTNDDPRATESLEQAVRATASRPGGCAVWATIQAPPVRGVAYAAANRLLARLAGDQELAGGLGSWTGTARWQRSRRCWPATGCTARRRATAPAPSCTRGRSVPARGRAFSNDHQRRGWYGFRSLNGQNADHPCL